MQAVLKRAGEHKKPKTRRVDGGGGREEEWFGCGTVRVGSKAPVARIMSAITHVSTLFWYTAAGTAPVVRSLRADRQLLCTYDGPEMKLRWLHVGMQSLYHLQMAFLSACSVNDPRNMCKHLTNGSCGIRGRYKTKDQWNQLVCSCYVSL